MNIKYSKDKIIFLSIFILLIYLCTIMLEKEVFINLFSLAIVYIFLIIPIYKLNIRIDKKIIGLFILSAFLVYFQLITDNYYFGDEFWMYNGNGLGINFSIAMGRFYQGAIADIFKFVNYYTIKYVRLFQVLNLLIFSLLFFYWNNVKSKNIIFSIIYTVICCYSTISTDLVSYAAIPSYTFGLVLITSSMLIYDLKLKNSNILNKQSIFYTMLCIFFIFLSFHSYQIIVPFAFSLYSISFYFNDYFKFEIKKFIKYIFLMGVSSTIYLISLKFLKYFFNAEISDRSSIISSSIEIIDKIKWFFGSVISNSFDRLVSVILGQPFFNEMNLWYKLTPKSEFYIFFNLIKIVFFILFLIGFLNFYKKNYRRNLVEFLIRIILLISTYAIYLLLKEDGYLSYYAYPLYTTMIFYVLNGVKILTSNIKNVRITTICTYIIVLIIIFNNIYYISKFWIYENKESYNFIKYSIYSKLSLNKNINRIHVFGAPYYAQAGAYSKMATELVLKDLGENIEDYKITVSFNPYYLLTIEDYEYNEMIEKLNEEDIKKLEFYYNYGETYKQYYIDNSKIISDNNLKDIQKVFNKLDIIPIDNDNCIFVDLRWKDKRI